jgi:hypothetical protein
VEDSPTRVPLTATQRLRLIAEIIPFFVWIVIALFTITFMDDIINAPVPPLLYVIIVLVLAVTGFTAVRRSRDLITGSALVQVDLLNELRRSRSGQRRTPYGFFETLGKMRMLPSVYVPAQPGARYRVTYSPVSKIVWELEKV